MSGPSTSNHSRAFKAAQEALDEADKEKRAAQRNVDRLQEELETARTILAVAQSVYDEKYTILLSLEECGDYDAGDPVATDIDTKPSNYIKYPPAARRLSAMNPHAANRLKSLRIEDSIYRRSSSTTHGSQEPQYRQSLALSVEDAARIVAEEDEREEERKRRTQQLATIRSERNLGQEDDSEDIGLDRSHHERIQMFNESMAFGGMSSLQMVTSSSSCGGSHLSRPMRWLSSFRRLDPRYQIYNFFEDVAQEGVDNIINSSFQQPALLKLLTRASAFSVWRPTSMDAIRKMMSGEATGKGLEIKGKSAKKGMLSSLVPFVQIYEEQHKERIRECVKDGTMRVFFPTERARDEAAEMLNDVVEMMMFFVQDAMHVSILFFIGGDKGGSRSRHSYSYCYQPVLTFSSF